MKKQLDPKVFENAALLIFNKKRYYACHAIAAVTQNKRQYINSFKIFKPRGSLEFLPWWASVIHERKQFKKDIEARTLALLFMAEIIKDEASKK